MMDILYYLGRFHVLVLHLPIGILLLAVVLEVASRRPRFAYLAPAVTAVWLLGALSAIATALLGYLHAGEGGFDGPGVSAHRLAGTSLVVLALGTWFVRAKLCGFYDKAWIAFSIATVALLAVTGHFGGNLTHGENYLALPQSRPAHSGVADLYLDVVAPALEQRCGSCHNDNKKKGGFSVASYTTLLKGGEKGAVIVPGKVDESDLVRRISLPSTDEDFMPRDGKTPLNAEQTEAIKQWVALGAPRTAPYSPPRVANAQTSKPAAATIDVPQPDPAALDALEANGFVVRAIEVGSPLVQADFTANRTITDADLDALARIGPQLHSLNLRSAGITDAQLTKLASLKQLARLRLELNPITDAGVEQLRPLQALEYLNLYGTRIGDAGLASLDSLPNLRELFIWQTGISPAALDRFRRVHAQLRIVDGFDPNTFPDGPSVIPVVN